jgi:hypothetical protein
MIAHVIRFIKRVAVLIPGLIITYFVIKEFYPFIERRLPASIAILATYMVIAYGLIPLAMRLVRLVIKTKHLPLYCVTPDGFASDPVNIGIIGTREELIRAMTKAGWYQADKRTLKTLTTMILAIAFEKLYRNAPFSTLYLFGRSQDLGFQKPLDNNPLHRHHVRFWETTFNVDTQFRDDVFFWKLQHDSEDQQRPFWVGAASLDTGFAFIRHNAQLTHMIHPDTNAERALIVKDLKKAGLVKKTHTVVIDNPYKLRNRVWRGILHTDGKLCICELKNSKVKQRKKHPTKK